MTLAEWREFVDLAQFEAAAEQRWSPAARAFIQEASGTGMSLRANRAALAAWALRSRVLCDVSSISTATTVLGSELSVPVMIAPSALHNLSTPEGEVATARGARAAGTVFVLSASTSRSIAEVRAEGADTWFQFYWSADRGRTAAQVQQAEASGCSALCLTADMPVRPVLSAAMVPGVRGVASERPLYVQPRGAHLDDDAWDHDARLTWADLEWLRGCTDLPLVIKGVMTAEDARLAADNGVDAVIVSNHGGRALDTPRGTVEALPEVVEALSGTGVESYVDGGFRTGSDVAVALSLGARAVLIGRPAVWGLAAGGAGGLAAVIELLGAQLRSVMGMVGARSLDELDGTRVAPAGRSAA